MRARRTKRERRYRRAPDHRGLPPGALVPLAQLPTAQYQRGHAEKKVFDTFCSAHRHLRAWSRTDPIAFGGHLVYPCRWGDDVTSGPSGGEPHFHIGRPHRRHTT